MFLPIRDALPGLRVPVITIALICLNVLVWLLGMLPADTQVAGATSTVRQHDLWLAEYGLVPCELTGRCENQPGQVAIDGGIFDSSPRTVVAQVDSHPPALTLLTSMFLHGGVLHLAFNMLFLWVYGNNVEDAMHPLSFLAFYLMAGMFAGLAQAIVVAGATVPTVGASGAIAAVIGAYLVLYPRVLVLTVVFPPFVAWLPAWAVAGAWGMVQLVATWKSVFAPTVLDGGIAYVAHFAGFAFGALAVALLADRRNPAYQELYGPDGRGLGEDQP